MKIRTAEILSDKLSEDLIWRKKELTDIKYYIELKSLSSFRTNVLSRAGIAILYAHWEGFIKESSIKYLEYVSLQRLKYSELRHNFIAIIIKQLLSGISEVKKASTYNMLADFFVGRMNERCRIVYKDAIDVESNLSSKVFKEIVWCLGLDYKPFETSEKVIDEKLLSIRNKVSHGEYIQIDSNDYIDLQSRIINLMNIYKNEIENAAVTRLFKV